MPWTAGSKAVNVQLQLLQMYTCTLNFTRKFDNIQIDNLT